MQTILFLQFTSSLTDVFSINYEKSAMINYVAILEIFNNGTDRYVIPMLHPPL